MAKVKTGPKVKRKGGGVPAKATKVDSFVGELKGARAIIVTEYRGLKVGELQELRRRLRPKGVEYHVVKNSIYGRAAMAAGKDELRPLLTGPTAVALGTVDEVDVAKGVVDELRTLKALRILGGLIGTQRLSADDVQSLAKLPGKKQLQAMIVGTLQAPLANVVGLMTAAQAQLIRVLQAKGAQA